MEPEQVFRSDFPWPLLKALTAGFRDAYPAADGLTKREYSDEKVRINSLPLNRRQKIEDAMLRIGKEFGATWSKGRWKTEPIPSGSSWWFHAELHFGRVVLTQNPGRDDDTQIRDAGYKKDLAQGTRQLLLFDSEENEAPAGAELFAVLFHRRDKDPAKLGAAWIAFPRVTPNGDWNGFYPGKIDLMEEFYELFTEPEQENIADTAIPMIREVREAN